MCLHLPHKSCRQSEGSWSCCTPPAAAWSAGPTHHRSHAGTCQLWAWPASTAQRSSTTWSDIGATNSQTPGSAVTIKSTHYCSSKTLCWCECRHGGIAAGPAVSGYLCDAAAFHHGGCEGALDGVQILLGGAACMHARVMVLRYTLPTSSTITG